MYRYYRRILLHLDLVLASMYHMSTYTGRKAAYPPGAVGLDLPATQAVWILLDLHVHVVLASMRISSSVTTAVGYIYY